MDNLPDNYWYEGSDLVKFEWILTSSQIAITNHNLINDELIKLPNIGNIITNTCKK